MKWFLRQDTEGAVGYLFRAKKVSYSFEAVENASYSTPLGKHLDNPQETEEFMDRIRKLAQNRRKGGNADKIKDKT